MNRESLFIERGKKVGFEGIGFGRLIDWEVGR